MTRDNTSDRNVVLHEYARLAAEYDSRWSFYVRATTRETILRLSVHAGDNVLDVGCGTGALLSQLAASVPDAVFCGVDASCEMLEVAQYRLPSTIELKQGWAEELPYSDYTFNTVVSCNMFHYIRRPHAALDEMIRVLRPNGTLVITDWCDDYLACKMYDWYLRCFDRSHFRTYGVRQCRRLLKAADARDITIDKYKITWLWGLMTAIAHKSADAQLSLENVDTSPIQSAE